MNAKIVEMYYPFARFNLIVPLQQEQRLRGTCFRGERKAGCFIRWRTAADVVLDPQVKAQLEEEIEDILDSKDFQPGDYSFTMELNDWVGWDSTASLEEVAGLQTEQRPLNKRTTALFVADPRFKARLTKLLTMIVKIQEDSRRAGDVAVLLESMYPGQDVGPLRGDVTAREGRIFLDWEQKGQSIPRSNPDETIPLGECFSWAYRRQSITSLG